MQLIVTLTFDRVNYYIEYLHHFEYLFREIDKKIL